MIFIINKHFQPSNRGSVSLLLHRAALICYILYVSYRVIKLYRNIHIITPDIAIIHHSVKPSLMN